MKSIKHEILISFCILAIVSIAVLSIVVSWKLGESISSQSERVSSAMRLQMLEILHGHCRILELFIQNLQQDVRRIGNNLSRMPDIVSGLPSLQIERLKNVLQVTAETEGIDFVLLFESEGTLIASFPPDLNALEVSKRVHSWEIGKRIQDFFDNRASDTSSVKTDVVFKHDADEIMLLELDSLDTSDQGAISLISTGIIMDELGDPTGFYFIGKLLNNHEMPLQNVYDTTGSANVIYLDTTPIVQAGFNRTESADFALSSLQIDVDAITAIYHAATRKEQVLPLAETTYLTVCSALESFENTKIGALCVGVPESQVTETQQEMISYGTETQKEMQTWIMGVGVLLLGLFAAVSLGIATKIVRPLIKGVDFAKSVAKGDLSVELDADQKNEVGTLANSLKEMKNGIQDVTRLAEEIARGNLTVTVTERSEEDTLMRALSKMIHNLNALVGQIQQTGSRINSSSTELMATAKQQETTMGNHVEFTNTVVESVQEISEVMSNLVETMQQVASISEETPGETHGNQVNLQRMQEAMTQMGHASVAVSGKLEVISEKANNISTVIGTITRVADQTNLLSLNAAIEAEKAGEYGTGFTVVAREIRRLADQTSVATLDIEQMVGEMHSAVSAGVTEIDKFIEAVRHNTEDASHISTQLIALIEQVQALTPNLEELNAAVRRLSEQTSQTQHSLRESYFAIEQLNEATRDLQEEITRFTVN